MAVAEDGSLLATRGGGATATVWSLAGLFEEFVQERVMAGETIFGLYPPAPETREAFRSWRAARQKV